MRSACVLLLTFGTAYADKLDVDGDGKLDDVELRDGALHVNGTRRLALAGARASFEAAKTASGIWLVVKAGDKGYLVNARTWQLAGTTQLGGVGIDREYEIDVAATPEGVFKFQKRGDMKRCDGKPGMLFPERLDAKGPATPPIAVGTATTITAKPDAGAPVPILYQARVASHQVGAPDAGALAIPRELDDGNPSTAWREDLPSHGEGQFFTFVPRVDSARAATLRIVPAAKAFNRLKTIAIVSAREAYRVELPDGTAPLAIDLPQPVSGCVTVIVESVHGRGTTAVAELEVFAEGERTGGGEALLAKIIAEGKSGETNAAAALAKRGAAAAAALDAELAKTTDAAARRRLVGALAKIADPAAVPALVRAATSGWVRGQDLLDVIAALGASGQTAALKELAAKGGPPVDVRVAAVVQIKPTGAGYDALVELAGKGPREVRRAVIERLALAPATQLAQTAAAQTAGSTAGDVWRALTRRARSHAAERPAAVTAMAAALATATDYDRRYRLVDGIAAYGDAAALRTLETTLAALPVAPQSAALRQTAVRSIASLPRAEATTLVIALARDADPGVRLAALAALAGSETDSAGAWHAADGPDSIDRVIINGLTADSWPEVRRRAASALGARCQRPGPARALVDAVANAKEDFEVRADALSALVQCKAAGIAELLAKTWADPKAQPELRERAVLQAIALDDPQLVRPLLASYTRWRSEAIESGPALKLAQSAPVALGNLSAPPRTADPAVIQTLVAALDDPAFPEIVAAAALGLGSMGKNCTPSVKTKLMAIARSNSQAATNARHAAGQCGR